MHEAWCKTGWTGEINAKVFFQKVASKFFATNATDPPHWTLNSCFGASRSTCVHLAMFRYYTILGAKHVELVQLMQKFMPWCRIRIFRNEHTQSTPLDSCLCVSHSVWMHLAMFHYFTKLVAKRVELVHLMRKFVPWSHFGIFHNECTRPTPLDPKLMYCCVS